MTFMSSEIWAADTLLRATIVLSTGALAAAAMPAAPAARRHLVWLLTACAALLVPVLSALLPAWHVLPVPAARRAVSSAAPAASAAPAVPAGAIRVAEVPSPVGPALPDRVGSLPPEKPLRNESAAVVPAEISPAGNSPAAHRLAPFLLVTWAAGLAVCLGRLLLAWLRVVQHTTGATPVRSGRLADALSQCRAEMGLRRRVGLRLSRRHAGPVTWGVVRPVVLLPAEAEEWPDDRVRLALLHELSHVKRLDALAQLIGQLAAAAYGFHPLAWLAAAGLRREQEQAADDLVLSLGAPRIDYASFLLDLAAAGVHRAAAGAGARGTVVIAMARPATIERRLRAILDDRRSKAPLSPRSALAASFLALALVVPVASLRGQSPPATAPATPATPKAPPTQPAAGAAYAGRVLSPEGKPVAGADVRLLRYKSKGAGDEEVGAARSADDGAFSMPAAPPDGSEATPWVQAWAPGFAPAAVRVEPARDSAKDLEVRLAAPSSLRVVFLDPEGRPVPGLRVTPTRTMSNATITAGFAQQVDYARDWSARFTRTTGADGTCLFDTLPRLSRTLLTLNDDRFAQLSLADELQTGAGDRTDPVVVRLKPAGLISGKVTFGTTGAPAPGVRLIAIDRKGGDSYGAYGDVVTNDRGEYRIPRVREGNFVIRVLDANDLGWTAVFLSDVHVTPGGTVANQDLVLVKGAIVHGRVYEADTGHPFANAWVNAVDLKTLEYAASARTDADGRFTLRVPPGRQGIYLTQPPPDGYYSEGFDGAGNRSLELNATDGADLTADLKLTPKRGRPVTGVVLGPDRKPLAGATVSAQGPESELRPNSSHTVTDAEGHFRFRAVGPDTRLTVSHGKDGTLVPVRVQGGETDVILRVSRNVKTTARGTIVDRDGKPIPNAAIRINVTFDRYGYGDGAPATLTDSAGHFSVPGLGPEGHYSLAVTAEGFQGISAPLSFKPGEENFDLGNLSLEPQRTPGK